MNIFEKNISSASSEKNDEKGRVESEEIEQDNSKSENLSREYREKEFKKRMSANKKNTKNNLLGKNTVQNPSGAVGIERIIKPMSDFPEEDSSQLTERTNDLADLYRKQQFDERLISSRKQIEDNLPSDELVANSSGALGVHKERMAKQEIPSSENEDQFIVGSNGESENIITDSKEKTEEANIPEDSSGKVESEFNVPSDERELIKYGREHFNKLGETSLKNFQESFDEKTLAHFKQFVEQIVGSLIDAKKASGATGKYIDNVASVLGSSGPAINILIRMMSLKSGRVVRPEEIEKMPFSRVAKELLEIDIEKNYKGYFDHFSRRS